ncbi:SMI1/KNR4 family protein [Bacillus altitudinis]|uniref:SMI1/KNR4 family protein n=1 Tax=Bacillus altitudinis TaxID=293387 RepID=A0ABV1S0R0_BACAB|nr:SMI1/KNR4 family protein [Bacillus altitudinis]MBY0185057.1 SMI1/KNR4 family protein [Bacillus aerophilus]MCW4359412.1 SMI1/KNR4 family protein [Bacillus altitudinis]MCY7580444.1 SMI1/KNR4 family protein [Bacillus altitudinis]MCY7596226.1 SMI1/KNR4 family protein [Bacillus altitudinis]NOL34474.1 SMI1/KNR4 family protein [Bacillus altitudinis]
MRYEQIKSNRENSFFPVIEKEIMNVEKELDLKLPKELIHFYLEVGYGFINGSEYNINRLMDPYSVRDFRLRVNDFEFYPDIEIFDKYENNKLIFFEANETALMSIELNEIDRSAVFYYDVKIADSLEEFLIKIQENDKYYLNLLIDE